MNNKTIFLHVSGNDYSALDFEDNYNTKEIYEEMIKNNLTKKIIDNEESYIEIEIIEFEMIDPDFIIFMLNNLCDYDQLKAENIYQIK